MIIAASEFNEVFRSFRRAMDTDVLNNPGLILFLLISGLLVFFISAYYLYRYISAYREQLRLDQMVREMLTERCGLNAREKSWLKDAIAKRRTKPTYKPFVYKSYLRRLLNDRQIRKTGIDPDMLIKKIFR